jgi:hypothetical protein
MKHRITFDYPKNLKITAAEGDFLGEYVHDGVRCKRKDEREFRASGCIGFLEGNSGPTVLVKPYRYPPDNKGFWNHPGSKAAHVYRDVVMSSAYKNLILPDDDWDRRTCMLDFERWGWGINCLKVSLFRNLWETLPYTIAVSRAVDDGYTGTEAMLMGMYYMYRSNYSHGLYSGQWMFDARGHYNISLVEIMMARAGAATAEDPYCGADRGCSVGKTGDINTLYEGLPREELSINYNGPVTGTLQHQRIAEIIISELYSDQTNHEYATINYEHPGYDWDEEYEEDMYWDD